MMAIPSHYKIANSSKEEDNQGQSEGNYSNGFEEWYRFTYARFKKLLLTQLLSQTATLSLSANAWGKDCMRHCRLGQGILIGVLDAHE